MKLEELLVQALVDLLKGLMQQDERFLITNQSLYKLFSFYNGELVLAIRQGSGAELLEEWKKEVPEFRAEWLASPGAATTMFRGRSVVIVTESATADARQKCEHRKKKGRKGTSRVQRPASSRRRA